MLPRFISCSTSATRVLKVALLLAALVAASVRSGAQINLPDAQLQANIHESLDSAPELAKESIAVHTIAGTVTLSGSVHDEATRRKVETLTANTVGVRKVVDEIVLASDAPADSTLQSETAPLVLQSDGSYAPATQMQQQRTPLSVKEDNVDPSGRRPLTSLPSTPSADPNAANSVHEPPPRQATNPGQYSPGYPSPYKPSLQAQQADYGGQPAGQPVLVPAGTLIRVRINRTLSSDKSQPATAFDGIVLNDVAADGFVAIPRGAAVQGTVVDSRSSGTLKGRGELSIELHQVILAGHTYPIVTDTWAHHGGDKTIETVNKTAGFGAAGLILGALAGGGAGAAIGGGLGAAAGLGSSAASANGQVHLPSESVLTFHLAHDARLATVSQQEMQRLAYGVAAGADQPNLRPRRYPHIYPGPLYPAPYPFRNGPYSPYGPYAPYGPYTYPPY